MRCDRIDATWVLDPPIDSKSFRIYVRERLMPTLQRGDAVVLDNLSSHKAKEVRRLLRSVGAKLFILPPYSPDLNTIEQVFAKLKALLRKAAERSWEAVCNRMGTLLDTFTLTECANYVRNSGYVSI